MKTGCKTFGWPEVRYVQTTVLAGFRVEYRAVNNYQYYFGVPYYKYSIMGPKTLFQLLKPILGFSVMSWALARATEAEKCTENRALGAEYPRPKRLNLGFEVTREKKV